MHFREYSSIVVRNGHHPSIMHDISLHSEHVWVTFENCLLYAAWNLVMVPGARLGVRAVMKWYLLRFFGVYLRLLDNWSLNSNSALLHPSPSSAYPSLAPVLRSQGQHYPSLDDRLGCWEELDLDF